jgi:hydroxymethylbilane synthase
MPPVKIGTRASALARWQTDHLLSLWSTLEPELDVQVVLLSSVGDDLPEAPLEVMEGTGFFTSTLERALLDGRIDVAVHSYKDLPTEATPGLAIAMVPERGPIEDTLCARDGMTLAQLPAGARVGTSSPRRTAQLRALRPDLDYTTLRGNVPTRLGRVERGEMDAVVLARAGIVRLGLGDRATEIFPVSQLLPAPAQGALAIQTRTESVALRHRLAPLEHPPTRAAVLAEREVLHMLRGGCSVPVGAHAQVAGGHVTVDAGVFALEGSPVHRVTVSGISPQIVGAEAARKLLDLGAGAILAALDRTPRVSNGGRA